MYKVKWALFKKPNIPASYYIVGGPSAWVSFTSVSLFPINNECELEWIREKGECNMRAEYRPGSYVADGGNEARCSAVSPMPSCWRSKASDTLHI